VAWGKRWWGVVYGAGVHVQNNPYVTILLIGSRRGEGWCLDCGYIEGNRAPVPSNFTWAMGSLHEVKRVREDKEAREGV
jgi:hypothetical protein